MKLVFRSASNSKTYEYSRTLLLAALASTSALTLTISGYRLTESAKQYYVSALIIVVIYVLLILKLHGWMRLKKYIFSAYTFIALLALASFQMLWTYSFRLPETLLALALIIVITSVVMGGRIGLICTGLVSIGVLAVSILQLSGRLQPDLRWVSKDPDFFDALSYAFVFLIIGLTAWLSNRDGERSLQRALHSEAALKRERDSLELKVAERSRQLEQAQLLHTLELQRFAEFGRLSASLLHELASPLTAASINLQQHTGKNSRALTQVQKNLEQIQQYVLSARMQLQGEDTRKRFNVKNELAHISTLLMPLARNDQISVEFEQAGEYWLFGDPVKFNQMMGNLIMNAIDASRSGRSAKSKHVTIKVTADRDTVHLTVADWGSGIKSENLKHIFEPFYTTKSRRGRGLGIGLALVKAYVEDEFAGSITAQSSPKTGTVFSVRLRRNQKSPATQASSS